MIDAQTGETLLPRLRLATRFWDRFRGLQLHPPLSPEQGLLLYPCNSVHTCFVHFPLDIFFCDERGIVRKVISEAKPWRTIALERQSRLVIETAARSTPLLRKGQTIRLQLPASGRQSLPSLLLQLSCD